MQSPKLSEKNFLVKPNLKDMSLAELETFISRFGKEKYRARQIMKWLYQSNAGSFEDMTDLSKAFRNEIQDAARIALPEIVEIQVSRDGTKKILFGLEDGHFIESVLIPGKNHCTVCVSPRPDVRWGVHSV